MRTRFNYDNIRYRYEPERKRVVISGEITNLSGRNYISIVFKMILFIRSRPIGNLTITIRAFGDGRTKTFEEAVQEMDLAPLVLPEMLRPDIVSYDIYPEEAY